VNPIVQYVLEVVVLPALIAVSAFSPFLFAPLRRRAWRIEAALGTIIALAFHLSFVTGLDHRAVLRLNGLTERSVVRPGQSLRLR